jgi:D-beta-D-heptose 7-phosphate kinase/D-beta-D-heptose 1-phosphate adenosyltransferase
MTDTSDLAALVDTLRGARVLCLGDVMLDRFVYGEVTRVSPEAPIPVCRITDETSMLGGAGNVVRNLVALGARADTVFVVGDDDPGREVSRLVDGLAGVKSVVLNEPGRPTTVKTRYFASGQQLLRADHESDAAIASTTEEALVRAASKMLAVAGVLVLSDYGKGALTPGVVARLIARARELDVPVIVDPKGTDYSRYRGATIVTPNRRELAEATGRKLGGDDDIVSAANSLIEACEIGAVLVTRSAEGMTLVAPRAAHHLKAEAREVFDVSGAGDTVVAWLAAACAAGIAPVDSARLANIAAGIVVSKSGTAVVHPDEVMDALRASELLSGERKAVSLAVALDRIAAWRRRGERIAFTNGCFDLIHPGHVSLLSQARATADRLVVGLNSDASTKRLKGPKRPIQSETARAAVLGSFAAVDLVVIFDEDTPTKLIEALRPDVLVKGADYRVDQVVGAEFVQSYGGRVVLAELAEGHSTTATIRRMAG